MALDEREQPFKDLRDNQVVQGQLLHRVETNLDRLEGKVEQLAEKLDRLEDMVERNSQAIAKLADGMILLQSAMQGLVATVDRFIRGMEHNGHHPPEGGPEGVH